MNFFGQQAIRRQMQVEAAERRRNENDSRGIKDIDKVRRQQQRAAQMEKDELEAAKHGAGEPALRVNIPLVQHAAEINCQKSHRFLFLFSPSVAI